MFDQNSLWIVGDVKVWHDYYDWLTELKDNIELMIKDNELKIIYMAKNNEYEFYINKLEI